MRNFGKKTTQNCKKKKVVKISSGFWGGFSSQKQTPHLAKYYIADVLFLELVNPACVQPPP